MDVKNIYKSSWNFFVNNYTKFLPLVALFFIISLITEADTVINKFIPDVAYDWYSIVLIAVSLFAFAYLIKINLALFVSVNSLLKNEEINTGKALRSAKGIMRLIGNTFLIILIWLIPYVLLGLFFGFTSIVTLYIFTYFTESLYPFISQIILFEEKKGVIRRNFRLMKGIYLKLFLLNAPILIVIIYGLLENTLGIQWMFYYRMGYLLLSIFFVLPFSAVILTNVYQQLISRERGNE